MCRRSSQRPRSSAAFFFVPCRPAEKVLVSLTVTASTEEGTMFATTINSSWGERSRRGLTTLSSFAVQALVGGLLLILPLLRPTGLPSLRPLSTPVSLGQPLGEAPAVRPHASGSVPNNP